MTRSAYSTNGRSARVRTEVPLTAGDIMCFDNRRVLHGRDAFTGSGKRHLQGIYIDRDEIMSRGRALNRAAASVAGSNGS